MNKFAMIMSAMLMTLNVTAEVINITDSDTQGNIEWTSDNEYILNGFVFVENGETLTIEAGTVIRGERGEGANASALIVARGGKIYANGTYHDPIIFTALDDDLLDPHDFGPADSGEWGGVILLGRAPINSPESTLETVGFIEDNIEGIPTTEPRGKFGGLNPHDSSGVIRYVSIRHGGTNIGANNEINGLTFGGVGDGTIVEFVEVFANKDDGFEFFGGTVNAKYLFASYCGDDSFDYDQGWSGKGQYWLSFMTGDRGGEHDGDVDDWNNFPLSNPTIVNATYISNGNGSGDAIKLRENAAGKYYNSIFMNYGDKFLDIEDAANVDNFDFRNNIYGYFGSSDLNYSTDAAQKFFESEYNNIEIQVEDIIDSAFLYNRTDDLYDIEDPWFDNADHIGAIGSVNWVAGWTASSEQRVIPTRNAGPIDYDVTLFQLQSGFSMVSNPYNEAQISDLFSAAPYGTVIYKFDPSTGSYTSFTKIQGLEWALAGEETLNHAEAVFIQIPDGEYYNLVIEKN